MADATLAAARAAIPPLYREAETAVLERLVLNLEAHLEELKTLLDKKPKNDASRQRLSSGKVTIDDNEYEVNDDFKQQTLELADALDDPGLSTLANDTIRPEHG